jgi:hypothetical protein
MDYKELLQKRAKQSKVYSSHQMIGLMIAEALEDREHKALYIKLAKNEDSDKLLKLAKSVAEKKDVRNKGAYFMRVWQMENKRQKERENLHSK